MNSFLTDSYLTQCGCIHAGHFVFVQRWAELFDPATIDSYSVKLRNSHGILREIKDVILQVNEGQVQSINLDDLVMEGRSLVERDPCIKSHDSALLGAILSGLKKVERDKPSTIVHLGYRVGYALDVLDRNYFNWITQDLLESICRVPTSSDESENSQRVAETLVLTNLLASEVVGRGWSPRSLSRLGRLIWKKGPKDFDSRWKEFIERVTQTQEEFEVFFPVTDSNAVEFLRTFNVSAVDGASIIDEFPLTRRQVSRERLYIKESIHHFPDDLNAAAWAAKSRYDRYRGISRYYGLELSPARDAIVRLPTGNVTKYEFQRTPSRHNLIFNAPSDLLSNEIYKPVLSAVGQFLWATEAASLEVKYVSLWFALESLVLTRHHESNIGHIKAVVPAILCSRYLDRLLSTFLDDCSNVGVKISYKHQPLSTTDSQLLLQLLRDKDETEYALLYEACSSFSLLQARAMSLRNSVKTNNDLEKTLKRHHEGIAWHLQRLYRLRNNVVHSGSTGGEALTEELANHLEFYLCSIIDEITRRLSHGGYSSVGELLSKLEDNYVVTVNLLKDNVSLDALVLLGGPLFQ
ncbi:MAG: hypothetical protein OWR62_06275 [Sulfobacillus thermotolerans]|nr:hypothetical protein [Sulfobacillus thermotolerans]